MLECPFLQIRALLIAWAVEGKHPNTSLVTKLIFNYLIIQNLVGADKYF